MSLGLKNKMEEFFETISDQEKSRNRKLNSQISFLKKYLGTLGESEAGNSPDESIHKYFHIQLRNDLGEVR
ncbi:MAG: hypothetical protein WC635_02030 [Bacteriovorax sp.]|jgi:hypothetical protein